MCSSLLCSWQEPFCFLSHVGSFSFTLCVFYVCTLLVWSFRLRCAAVLSCLNVVSSNVMCVMPCMYVYLSNCMYCIAQSCDAFHYIVLFCYVLWGNAHIVQCMHVFRMYPCMRVCNRMRMYVCSCVCMHVWLFVCISVYLFVSLYVRIFVCLLACLIVCLYVCLFVCMLVCVCNVCLYVCLFECMFVFRFVCMYVCVLFVRW